METKPKMRRAAAVRAAERRVRRAYAALQRAVEALGDAVADLADLAARGNPSGKSPAP